MTTATAHPRTNLTAIRADKSALLAALQEAGADTGNGKNFRCCFHDDHTPSAGVFEGQDGAWRFKCQSCGVGGDVFDVMALARKTTPAEIIRGLSTPRAVAPTPKRIYASLSELEAAGGQGHVATYQYGLTETTMVTLRYQTADGGKRFIQARPVPGGYVMGAPPKPWPLYDLAGVAKADTVIVVEGEGCVRALQELGIVATTSPGGAKNGEHADWTPLKGKRVYLWPDNDDPGRDYMAYVRSALEKLDCVIHIINVDSLNLPAKGDVVDVVEGQRLEAKDDAQIRAYIEALAAETPAAEIQQHAAKETAGDDEAPGLIVRLGSSIQTRLVAWLRRPIMVKAGINLICGMPDVGKGVYWSDAVSHLTTGTPWPPINGQRAECPLGTVAILSMEDSPETTIVPRLKAAGADLDKVVIVDGVNRRGADGEKMRDAFDISRDVLLLESLRLQYPDLLLVIIDPLDSYLSAKLDTNIGNKVRAALWPLKTWCEDSGVTVLIVHHFSKAITTNAMDKISGARSFGALPRSVWAIGRDENTDRTILAPVKANLIRREERGALAFEIRSSINNPDIPIITWLDETVATTANELLGDRSGKKRDEVADWLRMMLSDGPMDATELLQHAEQAGHSQSTLKRAKDEAGVVAEQRREGGKITGWIWKLPRA